MAPKYFIQSKPDFQVIKRTVYWKNTKNKSIEKRPDGGGAELRGGLATAH